MGGVTLATALADLPGWRSSNRAWKEDIILTIDAPMRTWNINGTAMYTSYCIVHPYPAQHTQNTTSGYHVDRVRATSQGKLTKSSGDLGFLLPFASHLVSTIRQSRSSSFPHPRDPMSVPMPIARYVKPMCSSSRW